MKWFPPKASLPLGVLQQVNLVPGEFPEMAAQNCRYDYRIIVLD